MYGRYYTSKQENIVRLIYIFNGNLVLDKRRAMFEVWHQKLNSRLHLNIPFLVSNCQVSLNTEILSRSERISLPGSLMLTLALIPTLVPNLKVQKDLRLQRWLIIYTILNLQLNFILHKKAKNVFY